MAAPEGGSARALGHALRGIRTSLPSPPGTVVSQTDVARRVLVGGKGAVSLYENGKRIPSAAVVRQYCDLAGIDAAVLLALREVAAAEARAATRLPEPVPIEPRAPVVARTRRTVLLAGCCAALGVGAGVAAGRLWAPTEDVVVDSPHHEATLVTTVSGTVEGFDRSDLWVDVQPLDETWHHLTDHPCDRRGRYFTFDEVHVGEARDHGRLFRVSVVSVRQGSAAEVALLAQGAGHRGGRSAIRSTDAATLHRMAYLPTGVSVVASVVVRRR